MVAKEPIVVFNGENHMPAAKNNSPATWITVRYSGNCTECGEFIDVGNRAVICESKLYCEQGCGEEIAGRDPGQE